MRVITLAGVGLALALLFGCSTRPPARVELQDATATVSGAGQAQAAAYITLRNDGGQDDALQSVTVTGARMATVHDSQMTDGVMRMMPVKEWSVPAGATVAMIPGGVHIMVMGLASPLREGDKLQARLRFRHTAPTTIVIPVRSLAAVEASRARD
jgi:periplasmic copper chaperone A